MRNKYLVETLAFANGSSPRRAQIKSSNRYFQIFASFKNQLSYTKVTTILIFHTR